MFKVSKVAYNLIFNRKLYQKQIDEIMQMPVLYAVASFAAWSWPTRFRRRPGQPFMLEHDHPLMNSSNVVKNEDDTLVLYNSLGEITQTIVAPKVLKYFEFVGGFIKYKERKFFSQNGSTMPKQTFYPVETVNRPVGWKDLPKLIKFMRSA